MRHRLLAALLAATPLTVPPAIAQTGAVTLAQVEARYPRMSEVHIVKCDRNGDGLFGNAELACVRSIYHAMYIED
jgi:hypothetical protein